MIKFISVNLSITWVTHLYRLHLYVVCGVEFSQSIMHVHVGNQIQQHMLQEITIDYLLK